MLYMNIFRDRTPAYGARGSAVGSSTVLAGRSRVRFPVLSLEFYGPGVDLVSNKNEYQEYFLWGKGGRCVRLITLSLSCADCPETWEPPNPVTLWACPGLYRDGCTFQEPPL